MYTRVYKYKIKKINNIMSYIMLTSVKKIKINCYDFNGMNRL